MLDPQTKVSNLCSCTMIFLCMYVVIMKMKCICSNMKLLVILSILFLDRVFMYCLFRHREQIIKQSTELVCRAYSEVYAAVMDPVNEYKEPESILHRSPQQVQTLLS